MTNAKSVFRINFRFLFSSLKIFFLGIHCLVAGAQDCPENIDFETGTFKKWTCYLGYVLDQRNKNTIILSRSGPIFNRHTIYTSSAGTDLDPYAKFPVNCPNGSGHSVRLGNDEGGAFAEGLSYEFTIPSNKTLFTLIYNYAIVFQESSHLEYQQPRFEVEVTNITRNEVLSCASFAFRPFGPVTPGFEIADGLVNGVRLWYKDWTPISLNLNGHAGETIKLFFKTADCTYFDHFGYAYIDVNSECNGEFTGAKYCPDDTLINLIAPPGYRNYRWYNNTFTQVLGTTQVLSISRQVIAGMPVPVKVTPNYGFGCVDTLYAKVADTLIVKANAGADMLSCNNSPVLIGDASVPGLAYSWKPSQGLSDPGVSNPLANPKAPTTYILTANSSGGGCVDIDTVFVNTAFISDSLEVIGKLNYCLGYGDSVILRAQNADNIQWFHNNFQINGATQREYKPTKTGTYYAALLNRNSCSVNTPKKIVNIDQQKPGISYPVKYTVAQTPIDLDARKFGNIVLWKPFVYLNNPKIISPVFTGNSEQSYTIEIKTNSGCITVDTQMVKIILHADIYVPTAFTPDQNGFNDILRPVLFGIKEFHYFKVFNRSGKLLFETKNPESGWDGKVRAIPQSSQVVVWVAEGMGWDSQVYFRKGISTILR